MLFSELGAVKNKSAKTWILEIITVWVFLLGLAMAILHENQGGMNDRSNGDDANEPCSSFCEKMAECSPPDLGSLFDTIHGCQDQCSLGWDRSSPLIECVMECDTESSCEDWLECYLDCAANFN